MQSRTATAFACLFLPAAALAGDPGPIDPAPIDPAQIISAVSWRGREDGNATDRAILYYGGEYGHDVNLAIFSPDKHYDYHLVAHNPSIVWAGNLFEIPSLTAREDGSLLVHSENYGIGRNKWEQTVTIGYQASGFVVTRYRFISIDSLDLEAGGACEADFVDGTVAVRRGGGGETSLTIENGARALAAFTHESLPDLCR